MAQDRLADVQPGAYVAGENVKFSLTPESGNFLLLFDSGPEVFVLYVDRASLGGRIFKYDSGATAMQVSSWGGITLYTDAKPNGLPAVRMGDETAFAPAAVSQSDMQNGAVNDAGHLAYARHLNLNFVTDWSGMTGNAALRALTFDALQNAARGIERLAASAAARAAIAAKVNIVQIAPGARPTLALRDKTLVVTFNPNRGYAGRASSRAIARGLATLLGVKGG